MLIYKYARIREQSHQLRHQQHVTSRAAFSIIAASSAEELATVLQNERRGQLLPGFKTPERNERKADVFQSQTYSIGTSKSVERLVALLNGAKRMDKDQNGNNGDESAQSSTVLCGSASRFQRYAFPKEDSKELISQRTNSVLSRVQAFEQGRDEHDTDVSKEKAKETRREPKKLKYLEQVHSTTTQLDNEERQKREAEIRPLGGIPKKFNMSSSCLPLPDKD
ncbi:hypothetical protein P5673_010725 [Acropora cervicornis]|uniref:Uncharacterized protein n=1 Tax=Acropora cervicornis TaxID=6130 RepID=A0AAD9QQD2_ACRCE|nr:hypothetical protein P5673_010725 [Acropora cervicornis]